MTREIKFRAWDKVNKKWLEQEYYYLIGLDGNFYSFSLGTLSKEPIEEIDIMQFTGLKDKNGREIYEGDILGDIYEGCYIGWCDECKQIQLRTPDECMACLGDVHWYELVEQDGKLEVIGNIYENKDLLN